MTAKEILKALLDEFTIGDYIYAVREREGLGWHGPKVERFAELMAAAEEIKDG